MCRVNSASVCWRFFMEIHEWSEEKKLHFLLKPCKIDKWIDHREKRLFNLQYWITFLDLFPFFFELTFLSYFRSKAHWIYTWLQAIFSYLEHSLTTTHSPPPQSFPNHFWFLGCTFSHHSAILFSSAGYPYPLSPHWFYRNFYSSLLHSVSYTHLTLQTIYSV